MQEQSTVYIVDDDQHSRKAISTLVQMMGVHCESFESAEDFLEKYDSRRPACLVTDVRMIGMSGLDLQEKLKEKGISISVVVMTAFATTTTTVRAMRNGALTLIEKPCGDDEIWEAVRMGLRVDERCYRIECTRKELMQRFELLTPKERDVLDLVVAGDPNKVIARKLGVSIRTIENHRHKIFQKLEADSVAELVKMALTTGMVSESQSYSSTSNYL